MSKKNSNKGRGKVYRNIPLGLEKQLQEAESISAQEDSDTPTDSSLACGQELPEENFQKW